MKTDIKSILGACALTIFLASFSVAQDAGSMKDAQTNDVYTEDDPYVEGGESQEPDQDQSPLTKEQDGTDVDTESQGQLAEDGGMTNPVNKYRVEKDDLPVVVADAIQDTKYADWTVAEVYQVTEDTEEGVVYEIHFQDSEGQTESASFDKRGEVVAR